MSLDGFIARKDGSYDWIEGHGTNKYDTPLQFDNPTFFQSCDTVIMGRNTQLKSKIAEVQSLCTIDLS